MENATHMQRKLNKTVSKMLSRLTGRCNAQEVRTSLNENERPSEELEFCEVSLHKPLRKSGCRDVLQIKFFGSRKKHAKQTGIFLITITDKLGLVEASPDHPSPTTTLPARLIRTSFHKQWSRSKALAIKIRNVSGEQVEMYLDAW